MFARCRAWNGAQWLFWPMSGRRSFKMLKNAISSRLSLSPFSPHGGCELRFTSKSPQSTVFDAADASKCFKSRFDRDFYFLQCSPHDADLNMHFDIWANLNMHFEALFRHRGKIVIEIAISSRFSLSPRFHAWRMWASSCVKITSIDSIWGCRSFKML